MNPTSTALAVLSSFSIAGRTGTSQAVVKFDGFFNNSGVSQTTYTNATGLGSTAQGLQFLAGGNPNEYRRVRHQLNVTGAPFNAAVFSLHLSIKIVYDLSTHGAITSINCGEGSINFTPTAVLPGNGQGSGLLICLGGRFYPRLLPL